MLKFSTTMKALELINKMNINLEVDFEDVQDLGTKILTQVITNMPKAQDEVIELVNEVCGKGYTKESDVIEIIKDIKIHGMEITKLFQSALSLSETMQ